MHSASVRPCHDARATRATTHASAARPAGYTWFLPQVHGRAALLYDRVVCCFPQLCSP